MHTLNNPGEISNVKKFYKGELLYDVNYRIDSLGARDFDHISSLKNEQIVLLGCSFVFGEGIDENSTLSYYLESLSKGKYYVYNFGMRGNSLFDTYYFINNIFPWDVIKGPKYFIYYLPLFIFQRMMTTPQFTSWSTGNTLNITLDKNKKIKVDGFLRDTFKYKVNKVINKSKIALSVRSLFVNEHDVTPHELARSKVLSLKIFQNLNDRIHHFYPKAELIVVVPTFRAYPEDDSEEKKITKYLNENGVRSLFFDEFEYFGMGYHQLSIPHDNHPKPTYNIGLANFILKSL